MKKDNLTFNDLIEADDLDFFEIIEMAERYEIFPVCYLRTKNSNDEYLAIGENDVFSCFNEIKIKKDESLFGAFKFEITGANDCYFFSPKILIKKTENKLEFTKNDPIIISNEKKEPSIDGSLKTLKESPSKNDWLELIEYIKTEHLPDLDKIVLSRLKTFDYEQRPSDIYILNNLKKDLSSYFFYLKTSQDHSIFSISPETLYKRKNQKIKIDAIAGTRSYDHKDRRKNF